MLRKVLNFKIETVKLFHKDIIHCKSILRSFSELTIYFGEINVVNLSFAGLLKQLCTILMASGVPADVLTEVGNFSYLFVCVHLPHNFYLLLLIIQSMLQHLFYVYFV